MVFFSCKLFFQNKSLMAPCSTEDRITPSRSECAAKTPCRQVRERKMANVRLPTSNIELTGKSPAPIRHRIDWDIAISLKLNVERWKLSVERSRPLGVLAAHSLSFGDPSPIISATGPTQHVRICRRCHLG